MKVLISVSCYKNESEIIEFAKMISNQDIANELALVVTCNACTNPDYIELELSKLDLVSRIYYPGKNLGYLHGALFGIRAFREEYSNLSFHWNVICNTDISIKNSFFSIITMKDWDNETWAIAPDVRRLSNGNKQNPFRQNRISRERMNQYRIIYSNPVTFLLFNYAVRIKRKIKKTEVPDISESKIYAEDGSIFILHEDCVSALLADDSEKLFMYGEEIYLAEIIRANKKIIEYYPRIQVIHNENGTTSLVGIKRKQKWFKESFDFIWDKYYKFEN